MKEMWLPIPGKFHKNFLVSDLGRVKSVRSYGSRILVPVSNGRGYLFVGLHLHGSNNLRYVHRLVCLSFLGTCPVGIQVNHLDGDKSNNKLSNLEYTTRIENSRHASDNGLYISGEESHLSKLTRRKILSIRGLSSRGWNNTEIASRFKITPSNVGQIIKRKTWKGI